MSYKAIYAYAWDLAENRRERGARPHSRARSRHRHGRRQLSRRQVSQAAWQGEGLFSRRRDRLFQGQSRALRRDQARPEFDAGRGYGDTLLNPLLSEDPLEALLRWLSA